MRNATCSGAVTPRVDYLTYCRLPNGIFIRPTLNIFADAFQISICVEKEIVREFCDGARKLRPG